MKKLYISFLLLFINLIAFATNFSVAPTRFELKVDKVTTNEVYLTNNTNKPLRIETYLESDKTFGENYNLNSNITIFPKVVTIKPAGKQIVRFRVKPGTNLKDGEHKSYIVFKEVPLEIKNIGEKNTLVGETSPNIVILAELGISVYGISGNETLKGDIENLKLNYKENTLGIKFDSISTGNTSFKYKYVVEDEKGKILSQGKAGNSLRNGKTNIGIALTKTDNYKGKNIKVKILDQKNNILEEKKIKISSL